MKRVFDIFELHSHRSNERRKKRRKKNNNNNKTQKSHEKRLKIIKSFFFLMKRNTQTELYRRSYITAQYIVYRLSFIAWNMKIIWNTTLTLLALFLLLLLFLASFVSFRFALFSRKSLWCGQFSEINMHNVQQF